MKVLEKGGKVLWMPTASSHFVAADDTLSQADNATPYTVVEKGKDAKPVKKQLEVDFICNKGSKKYYIQSAYMLETEAKMAQEIRPFLKINDSFKKIVITSDIPKPFYNDQGILIMNVYDFLLNADSLEL